MRAAVKSSAKTVMATRTHSFAMIAIKKMRVALCLIYWCKSPILAGIALCGGGIGAVSFDLFEQRREERKRSEQQGRPANTVLIRTFRDSKSWKAWMFLLGCSLYAVLGGATGYLQPEALADYNGNKEGSSETKGVLLIVYPILVGLSGVLMVLGVRLLPYDTYPRAGMATHVIVAGCFQMFAIIYCFSAAQLATTVFGEEAKITTLRRAFAYTSVVGLALSFLFGGYVMGKSAQLIQHQSDAIGTLIPKQVWANKCWMAALGGVQMSIGIAVSVVTASGAAEVNLFS
ncbi:hypothetical protein ACHAXR_003154 [Thalassiosira sp. AJA248-18]